jgi:hypothetical protein
MAELRIAIGMVRAFFGLASALQTYVLAVARLVS